MSTEIATTNNGPQYAVVDALPVDPKQLQRQVAVIQDAMKSVMQEGVHFGKVPGCGDKPSLLKPGAEKIGLLFRLVPYFDIKQTDFPNGHRELQILTTLKDIHGNTVGQGVGSCSTMESKYRYRNGERKCPQCAKPTIIKGKDEYGGGWICFARKGGCGAKFADGDAVIEKQAVGKVDNPDVADTYNTVLKMAKKRSHVDATLTCTAASDIFTQDVEDFPQYDFSEKKAPTVDVEPEAKPANGNGHAPKQNGNGRPAPASNGNGNGGQTTLANPFAQSVQFVKSDSQSSHAGRLLCEIYFEDATLLDLLWNQFRPSLTPQTIAALSAARNLIKKGDADSYAKDAYREEHGFEPDGEVNTESAREASEAA